MAKRSNLIVSLGLAVFVAGAAATFFVVRDHGTSSASSANGTTVLYATKTIPSGTSGVSAVDQGLVKSRSVANSAKPAGALTDPSQLAGKTAVDTLPEGAVLTDSQFAVPQTRLGTVTIPPGKTALALQLGAVPGVAGFVGNGDHIDIYGVAKDGPGAPSAKLIMQNTEVLNVTGGSPSATATAAATATSANATFLLAVSPAEAEHLVYLTSFQSLYFSLVSKDAAAVGGTPGSGAGDALKQLS
ncbi:MAG: Flp pilus assembly protein CpaB [Acidimicrobiales bacterium]